MDAVHRYLAGVRDRDWDLLDSACAPDIERRSPFSCEPAITGREAYVAFNANSIGAIASYRFEIRQLDYSADRRRAFVRGHEWVQYTPESPTLDWDMALWIDLGEADLIERIDVYIKLAEVFERPGRSRVG